MDPIRSTGARWKRLSWGTATGRAEVDSEREIIREVSLYDRDRTRSAADAELERVLNDPIGPKRSFMVCVPEASMSTTGELH